MSIHTFTDECTYKVCILIKSKNINLSQMRYYYLSGTTINPNDVYVLGLEYTDKISTKAINESLVDMLDTFKDLGTQFIYCADASYFKVMSKTKTPTQEIGYLHTYENMSLVYGINYTAMLYNDNLQDSLNITLNTLSNTYLNISSAVLGGGIIHQATYPNTYESIKQIINNLHQYSVLAVDIETYSLNFFKAGIATIGFSWSQHSGTSFCVTEEIKELLKTFFLSYTGKLIAHNANYDFKVLVYELFMEHDLDRTNMQLGIDLFTRDFEDTKVMAYLAFNNTKRVNLSLKELTYEFTGKYAQENIHDVTKIPTDELLKYNLTDCLATFYLYNKLTPLLVKDNQVDLYNALMKDTLKLILHMELVGMPLSLDKVSTTKEYLLNIRDTSYNELMQTAEVVEAIDIIKQSSLVKANAKLKTKVKSLDDFEHLEFNPNSSDHLSILLYTVMNLPVLDLTPTGKPSTAASAIQSLSAHTKSPIIKLIQDILGVSTILSTFIPAFEKARLKSDGMAYLHGSFNIGGAVSGRLSSCVAEWTLIKTMRGLVPISQLIVGDLVWTHKRQWKPVVDIIIKPVTPMVDIHFCNGYVLTCTNAHKLRLPDGVWKTVEEIVNERIEIVDAMPYKHCSSTGSLPSRPSLSHRTNRQKSRNYTAQRFTCDCKEPLPSRSCFKKSSEILPIKNWAFKSNERKNTRKASQLDRRVLRQSRLFNNCSQQQKAICTQSSNGSSSWFSGIAQRFGCASHRQQSTKQQVGQSSFSNIYRTSNNTLSASHVPYGKIQKVDNIRALQVWDITVADDHSYWAEGCFNHNSSPNLQNLPSNSTYGKVIKSCFTAPKGWLLVYADYSSLEDKISALITKDENKLRVYEDGFDGHALRAYNYFPHAYVGVENTVEAINATVSTHKHWRQLSKAPTFALTYLGSYRTLMSNCGFDEETAKSIEANYHKMYAQSDAYVDSRIKQAQLDGHIDVAFGLRIRTTAIHKTVLGTRVTPTIAAAEMRTLGNALGQSWCLLNSRSTSAFMKKVQQSIFKDSIYCISMIHDAAYFLVKADADVLMYINENLVAEMQWQQHPDIQHPTVHLGGELDVCYRGWHEPITLPNNCSKTALKAVLRAGIQKYQEQTK